MQASVATPISSDMECPTAAGSWNRRSVSSATAVVPRPSPTRLEIKRNSADTWARNWFGGRICMAAVEVGIGNEAKNIAGSSRPTDSHSPSTWVNATAGSAMPIAPMTPARSGASL